MGKADKSLYGSATITKNKILSSKGLQWISAILTLALDVAVLLMLIGNTTEFKFWLCPILLLALDFVFLIKVAFSNYRFHYAIKGVFIHIAAIAVVCAYAIISTELLEKRVVFEVFALYAMPVVHLIQCIASICNALHSVNRKKMVVKIVAISATAALVVGVAVYGNFVLKNGFFGQSNVKTERTVVYSLDESGQKYIVSDVLDGRGNTVVIPDTFNGLPVGGVDCSLFANDELMYVVFDCSPEIEFLNVDSLRQINKKLSIETSKTKLDSLRTTLYTLSLENVELLHLANNIYPSDMNDGEVYVTFGYDWDTLLMVKGSVLPTWFGLEGETFDIISHAQDVDYIEYSNSDDAGDLYWCQQNQNSKIFMAAIDENSNNILEAKIEESCHASVVFEQIYQLNIGEDNDTLYTIDTAYTGIQTPDGAKPYKLATASKIMSVLEAVPGRNGFDLDWRVGSDRHELESIEGELNIINGAGITSLSVYPVWSLHAPVIDQLEADGKSTNHSAVYGSDVKLTASATAPDKSISIKYEWVRNGNVANETSQYTINNLHPEDAGEYILKVTAYADFTSLTNTVEKNVTVGFEKKEINFAWILPEGNELIYSAQNKPITVVHDENDVINGDIITSRLSQDYVKNAGDYDITLALTGDADTKYKVSSSDNKRSLTISPYPLDVSWAETNSFVYNGEKQSPKATATGIGNDGVIDVSIVGSEKNVGTYNATATTNNKNYTLQNNTRTYTITPKPIYSVKWQDDTSFVYSATPQSPKVKNSSDILSADLNAVLNSLVYTGQEINVGRGYMVYVSMPEGGNYEFAGSCNVTESFDITKKAMSVKINNLNATYNGTTHTSFSYTVDGLAGTDTAQEVFWLDYSGDAIYAVNVNKDGYVIDAYISPELKYDNYDISVVTGKLTITPKKLEVTIQDASKPYDGKIYSSEGYTFLYTGLVEEFDSLDEVFTIVYGGTATQNSNAGTWVISATANEGVKYGNYTVSFTSANLIITQAPLTVTAIGGKKTYDGKAYTDFSFKAYGLVNGELESDLGTPVYGGAAKTAKNAGTHTLTVTFASNSMNKNYDIKYEFGEVVIDRAPLKVTALGGSKVYDGKVETTFDFKADGLVSGETKATLGTPEYYGEASENKNVGKHTLSVRFNSTAADNYNIEYVNGTFEITKKNVTVSAKSVSKVYDGIVGGSFEFYVSDLATGDTLAMFGEPEYSGEAKYAKNVGSYYLAVTVPGNENYNITAYYGATFTITKAPLTITAKAEPKTYDGMSGGSFSVDVSGLVSGETKDMLGTPNYSGNAVDAVNAGSYTISVTLPAQNLTNYDVTYKSGTFTIGKKDLKVTAVSQQKVYDGKICTDFDFKAEGLVGTDTKESLGNPTFGGAATRAKNQGNYGLTVSLPAQTTSNYEVEYVEGYLKIDKKDLKVIAIAENKTYDGIAGGKFDFEVDGLIDGETKSSLGDIIIGGTAKDAKNAGTYTLHIELAGNFVTDNYTITYFDAEFVISPKSAKVTAYATDRPYSEDAVVNEKYFGFTIDGLVDGDDADKFEASYDGDAVSATEVGKYTLTVTLTAIDGSENYAFEYASCEFYITEG